ncbi:MAG: hypothetical protein B7Y81_05045 [Caulobacter sp. 32-67-35]|nr:MAG: hypothetical protein B7Y81_05045 [Caulobacter sp. 32-67-35]
MKSSLVRSLAATLACVLPGGATAHAQDVNPAPAPRARTIGPPLAPTQPQASGLALVVIRDTRREEWRRVAVLREPWFYCSKVSRDLYAVPSGYVTDFASIPGFAKLLFPPFGTWAEAAVIHDWLYDVGAKGQKAQADRIFKEAMTDMKVGGLRKTVMHWAVSLGGGGAYRAAERRKPQDWAEHFVDRQGRARPAPFPQPVEAVWKRDFDCSRLEDQEEIWALQEDYLTQFPNAAWGRAGG